MIHTQKIHDHQHIVYGFLHDCPNTDPSDIHRHLCHSFQVDHSWKYATTSQFHSDIVLRVDAHWKETSSIWGGCVGDGDALITSEKNVFLCTRTADCVPVFLFGTQQIAVIHAGWRGIANQIIQKCCSMMDSIDGAIIGPCISQRNYEVDIDVIQAFEDIQLSRKDVALEYKDKKGQQKFRLDVQRAAHIQLQRAGIHESYIIGSSICTFESDALHSYRRDGIQSGRNWSCIALL